MQPSYIISRENSREPLAELRVIDQHTAWERRPMYALVKVPAGTFECKTDLAVYTVQGPALFFFTPYQQYALRSSAAFRGELLYFHGDFYCIEQHRHEVACNGVLFNNVYAPPFVLLDDENDAAVKNYLRLLGDDMQRKEDIARHDMVIAHLKILLIIATRLKLRQMQDEGNRLPAAAGPQLQQLHQLIEGHFSEWHKPADYAAALHISVKTLSRLTGKYLSKTPSALIAERIVQEAKRALHFSNLSVKEIAANIGFSDPFYFSRLFRKYTGVSPREFRENVGVVILTS
ncbi:AraC family transcriptional regulator [Chitinophaga sp.]|uniref:helix-turn-helix domain-containing protein n=1 Tax=Chitinophaga sp. TaxID=1869181 RepID=UPI0031DF7F9D